jgi:PhoH-like ATPase
MARRESGRARAGSAGFPRPADDPDPHPESARMARKPAISADIDVAATPTKFFVLDTNVLMHDPTSVYRFEEHDVFLPIMTLEELDNHKKGDVGNRPQCAPGHPYPR